MAGNFLIGTNLEAVADYFIWHWDSTWHGMGQYRDGRNIRFYFDLLHIPENDSRLVPRSDVIDKKLSVLITARQRLRRSLILQIHKAHLSVPELLNRCDHSPTRKYLRIILLNTMWCSDPFLRPSWEESFQLPLLRQ